jgi:hypothetical protein
MPSRGRHQSTSKECKKVIARIEAIAGVKGVIIGHSRGGKSLGRNQTTGSIKIQRREHNGFKSALQTEKGLQEAFILVESGMIDAVEKALKVFTD